MLKNSLSRGTGNPFTFLFESKGDVTWSVMRDTRVHWCIFEGCEFSDAV